MSANKQKHPKIEPKNLTTFTHLVIKNTVRVLLLLELNFLWFFTNTWFGYTIYGYCALTFVYGHHIAVTGNIYEQCIWFVSAVVVTDVLSMALLLYITLLFESGSRFIYTYVHKDYVIKCIGNPGSRALTRACLLVFGAMGSSILYQSAQHTLNQQSLQSYIDGCSAAGVPASEQSIKEIVLLNRQDPNDVGRILVSTPANMVKSILGGK